MTQNIEKFKEKGMLAIPWIGAASGMVGVHYFRIVAIPESIVRIDAAPRLRSIVISGFAIWRAIEKYSNQQEGEGASVDENISEAFAQSSNDLDAIRPHLLESEKLCREWWPYEALLCDQALSHNSLAAFCIPFPTLNEWPFLSPENPIGVSKITIADPSPRCKVESSVDSTDLLSMLAQSGVLSSIISAPTLASIPGVATNTLFDHEYFIPARSGKH
jgi:hypothetical protein